LRILKTGQQRRYLEKICTHKKAMFGMEEVRKLEKKGKSKKEMEG